MTHHGRSGRQSVRGESISETAAAAAAAGGEENKKQKNQPPFDTSKVQFTKDASDLLDVCCRRASSMRRAVPMSTSMSAVASGARPGVSKEV